MDHESRRNRLRAKYQAPMRNRVVSPIHVTASHNAPPLITPSKSDYEHFTVIMSGYNCDKWVEKSIESVCTQDYPKDKFNVMYADALSTDNSYNIVNNIRYGYDNFLFIVNEKRCYQVENILFMVKQQCKPKTICVTVDGDDWLPDNKVLQRLNQYYNPDVWMTYGIYAEYPGMISRASHYRGYGQHVIDTATYRSAAWQASHLRTWRRELFLKIEDKDLRDDRDGEYMKMVGDLTFMFPMLEMAGNHARHVDEVMYVYNNTNPLSEGRIDRPEVKRIEAMVRARKPYQRLEKLYDC